MSFDVESSGLLDGLEGAARTERAALLPWLIDQGFTVEEIRTSPAPMLLPARRVLGDDGSYVSARQISERAGLELDQLMRFQRAAGLPDVDDPDAPVFMRPDGDTATHIRRFLDLGIDTEATLTVVRVLADGLANASEVMRAAVMKAVLHPGVTELEIAQGAAAVVGAMAPLIGPMIHDMLLLQLRHMAEIEAVNAGERAAGAPLPGARMVAAAFADLVGFTSLGEEVPPEALEQLADRLASFTRSVVVPPVRFIKTIGDAVMLVSPDTTALLDVMLALLDTAATDETFPRLRVGVSYGAAVSRAGDWFGSPVNQASRVTSLARPGAVLVAESAREQVGENPDFRWSFAGPKRLRGIHGDVKLYRARRSEESDQS